MAQIRAWVLEEHRLSHGDRRARRNQAPESLSDPRQRARCGLDPGRRSWRPFGVVQCAGQGRSGSGSDGNAAQSGPRHSPPPKRRLGGAHGTRQHHRRDGGQCRGLLRAPGRRHGRCRRAHHQHAASLCGDSSDSCVHGAQRRDTGDARFLHLRLFPSGAEIRPDGRVREHRAARSMGPSRLPRVGLLERTVCGRPGSHSPLAGACHRAHAHLRRSGNQAGHQRRDSAHPRRRSAAGARGGLEEFLDVLRNLLRHRTRRRLR